jgi:hypothetical protein
VQANEWLPCEVMGWCEYPKCLERCHDQKCNSLCHTRPEPTTTPALGSGAGLPEFSCPMSNTIYTCKVCGVRSTPEQRIDFAGEDLCSDCFEFRSELKHRSEFLADLWGWEEKNGY